MDIIPHIIETEVMLASLPVWRREILTPFATRLCRAPELDGRVQVVLWHRDSVIAFGQYLAAHSFALVPGAYGTNYEALRSTPVVWTSNWHFASLALVDCFTPF